MTRLDARPDKYGKGKRALELQEQGLSYQQIAERIGGNPRSIGTMILAAKKQREKENAS